MSAAAARHGIENTLATYAESFSAGDVERTARCFTADARVRFPTCEAVGRPAVLRELTRLRAVFSAKDETPWLLIGGVLIEPAPPGGWSASTTYASFTRYADASLRPRSGGRYRDTFVESGPHWLIRERHVVVDARPSRPCRSTTS